MLTSIWQKLTQSISIRSIVFGLILTLFLLALKFSHALSTLEFTALNFIYTSRDNLPIHKDITFWNMDETDILSLRWPWSWEKMGHIVKGMHHNGVRVGLIQEDIFSEKRPPSLSEEAAIILLESLEEASQNPEEFKQAVQDSYVDNDLILRESLKNWPDAVLSHAFLIPDNQDSEIAKKRADKFEKGFISEKVEALKKIQAHSIPWPHEDELLKAINLSPLHPLISDVVGGVGFQRIIPDPDGTIRRIPTVVIYKERLYFSQAVIMAAKYLKCPIENLEVVPGVHVKFKGIPSQKGEGDFIIPIDEQGLMIVNWTAKDQMAEFSQTPFQFVKLFLVRAMAKEIANSIEFDPEDMSTFNTAFQTLENTFMKKVQGNGWITDDNLGGLYYKTALAWVYHTMLANGAGLSDIEFLNQIETFVQFDQLTFYNSIFLNLILAANYEEGEELPTIDDLLLSEDYEFYPHHFKYSFIESFIPETTMEILGEFELIEIDEDYAGDDSLVKLNYADLSKEEYTKKLIELTQLSEEALTEQFFFHLYNTIEQRNRIIQEGYRQMVHHLKEGTVDDVAPFYFFSPYLFKEKSGEDVYKSLYDFKDKAVFLGLTATGLNALNPTPYTQRYTMASLSPTALNTILTESYIYEKPEWEPLIILLYSILVLAIIFFLPAYISHPLTWAIAVGHVFIILHLMNNFGIVVALVFPVMSVMLSYLAGNLYLYWEQLQERKKVRGMFSAMVSPEVLKIMEEDPDKFNLQGEKVEASMFSSDVSGFTSISEGVTAQELALILNLYLTPMSNLVMAFGGYVEKYEGDAIKADFGMPMPDPDHAWKACFSALLQQEELFVVQRMLQIKYGVMITARMGVNTGVVNAGNMGSVNKMQYCAIGEEVAMAEELEPSNKMWETWIAISPETLRLSGDKLKTRLLDVVDYEYVTIPVYELLGWDQDSFLNYWNGKPIPKLVIEGWEKIIPEKVLAYLDYYSDHDFTGNAFYDLMVDSFKSIEEDCIKYIHVSDKLNLWDLEKRQRELLNLVDQMEVKITYDDLDLVDRTEWDGLEKAIELAKEEWLVLLNTYLFELKKRTHVVNRMVGKQDQDELDEVLTSIDTLEKNCNCYIKRNRFPGPDDRYGNIFKDHLMGIIPNPTQGFDESKLEQLRTEQNSFELKVKQGMTIFIEKAKPLSDAYHQMMSEHCLLKEDKLKTCEIFAEGRELYLDRKWDAAIEKFQAGLAIVPDDGPCMKYTERCQDFIKNPPDDNWEGVWEADW